MNDTEILEALDASGDCGACNSRGSVVVDQRWVPPATALTRHPACERCGGSSVDPGAVLRAVQAVGHLLIDVRERLTSQEGGR